ncbi:hypothetical protein [Brucella sp.]|uniref:hypothetical protein n=1 Tax=Brucella sp. TaxID=52132 RepID=UPI0028A6DA5E|nr:hypothetical protein [Brucella sp.]
MRQNRVPVMMSDVELASIDEWRWQNRISTRSEAIRQLCTKSLDADDLLEAMLNAERFIRGFEDDELQEGVTELLEQLRSVIADAGGKPT